MLTLFISICKELVQEYWDKRGGRPSSFRRPHHRELSDQIRHHSSAYYAHRNDQTKKTITNRQNSIKKRKSISHNNAVEVEGVDCVNSSEPIISRSNQNYNRRGDDDDEDDDLEEEGMKGDGRNYHHVKRAQRSSRIIRIRKPKNHNNKNNNSRHVAMAPGDEKLKHQGIDEMDSWEEYIESVDYVSFEKKTNELLVFVTW